MNLVIRGCLVLMIPAVMVCAAVAESRSGAARVTASAGFFTSRPAGDTIDTTNSAAAPEAQPDAIDDGAGAVDLYGNDVTAAVATYKLDAEGSMYELHSPQTELPRLASPKS